MDRDHPESLVDLRPVLDGVIEFWRVGAGWGACFKRILELDGRQVTAMHSDGRRGRAPAVRLTRHGIAA